jgi:hypothetical protein
MNSIFKVRGKIKLFYIIIAFLLSIMTSNSAAQMEPVGPGKGTFKNNHLTGKFINWDRKATPMLVLRVHGAGKLQTFAEISSDGEFKIPLPEIPPGKGYGSLTCGDPNKGRIVVVTDFNLLTTLPGFTSPGRWDRGMSEIGMATFADEKFSKNIGKPGGRRANWLYSEVDRIVDVGECNNTNSFRIEKGWNAFTVTSGPSGGPHTYNPGLDEDLGWYWYAFPEDIAQGTPPKPKQNVKPEPPAASGEVPKKEWLVGEWSGVQVDVQFQMSLQPSGDVWIESIESGRKKEMEGKWSLNNGEFVLEVTEGKLQFNIEQTSENTFRLFGKAATSDIVFTRK